MASLGIVIENNYDFANMIEFLVAVLTEKIRYMTEHLRMHHKDQRTKRAMQITIDKRRALLKHLKKQNVSTYYHLLKDLNLRDMVMID